MKTGEPSSRPSISKRLEQARQELEELAQAIKAGDIDPRVLREFRESVDHVRLTAWAVQQWLELKQANRDAYSVLPLLISERVRRATQLNRGLTDELDAVEVTIETEGLKSLFLALDQLMARLSPLFKPGDEAGPPTRARGS
ncbi:MAG: hypothetical protein ACRD35_03940 [Candidatus Acidiferrales bacterium]